jgi:hypothetical protein
MVGWLGAAPLALAQEVAPVLVQADRFEGVILPAEQAAELWHGATGSPPQGAWTPEEADVRKLEAGLQAYVQSAAPQRSPQLWQKLDGYKRQYAGVLLDGRRVIYVNFVCNAVVAEGRMDWQRQPILVEDGGDCFFQLRYDAELDAYTDLSVNGEA